MSKFISKLLFPVHVNASKLSINLAYLHVVSCIPTILYTGRNLYLPSFPVDMLKTRGEVRSVQCLSFILLSAVCATITGLCFLFC